MSALEVPKLDPREQHFRIPSERGMRLFLRHLGPASGSQVGKLVLYIHGATFPSALSIAHRFDGHSWRDELNTAGYDVWGLDFHGYGGSDRNPEMDQSPTGQPALGRAHDACNQVERAVRFIRERHGVPRISIIAHSWGSLPAALFAGKHPSLVDRLVHFAPIARRAHPAGPKRLPAWRLISLGQQWDRFVEDVPSGESPVLSRRHFDEWGELYLATDPDSRTRSPASVKVPNGPIQNIDDAGRGKLPYDPSLIQAPVAIIRGEWDHVVTDDDARWLFDAFKNSPNKRDIKIGRATHLAHLERGPYALYCETLAFLEAGDLPNSERTNTPEEESNQ